LSLDGALATLLGGWERSRKFSRENSSIVKSSKSIIEEDEFETITQ